MPNLLDDEEDEEEMLEGFFRFGEEYIGEVGFRNESLL
jgi:hypothetical protein